MVPTRRLVPGLLTLFRWLSMAGSSTRQCSCNSRYELTSFLGSAAASEPRKDSFRPELLRPKRLKKLAAARFKPNPVVCKEHLRRSIPWPPSRSAQGEGERHLGQRGVWKQAQVRKWWQQVSALQLGRPMWYSFSESIHPKFPKVGCLSDWFVIPRGWRSSFKIVWCLHARYQSSDGGDNW
jgi:hypothetical protein